MNSWNQPMNNNMMGGASFNAYNNTWNPYANVQPRVFNAPAPVYHAEPIQGSNAAWQFPMGPNSEIYLPDANEDIIWWIRTDGNGNRNVQAFDIKLHQEPAPVDTNDLAARLAAVEEWINAKSNKSNAKRNAATTATNEPIG